MSPADLPEIASLVFRSAAEFGSRTALVHGARRWTHDELADAVAASARWVATYASKGDRVAVLGNDDRAVIAILGAMAAGAIGVPLHHDTPAPRLRTILDDCAPALVIAADDAARRCGWAGAAGDLETAAVQPGLAVREPAVRVMAHDTAAIFYTSGSTRTPRGVVCPHRQMAFCTTAINSVIGNVREDVILSGRPLAFDYGFYQVLLALDAGATLILAGNLPAATALPRIIAQERVTGLPLVPSAIGALIHSRVLERTAFPSLRYITSTGDTLPPAHIAALRAALPRAQILPMYGLTECKRVSILPPSRLDGRERSVGLPLPGTSVRIVAESGRPAAPGEVGELYVRGPHLTDGYWRDRALTCERFVFVEQSGERELRTGDLFTRDAEGFLYFVSRADTIIKSLGERVGASEVEAVISAFPGVVETAVVGAPCDVMGEAVVAFVVTDGTAVDRRGLQQHCARTLPPAARPKCFVLSSKLLARTANGKIDRRLLRQLVTHDGNLVS